MSAVALRYNTISTRVSGIQILGCFYEDYKQAKSVGLKATRINGAQRSGVTQQNQSFITQLLWLLMTWFRKVTACPVSPEHAHSRTPRYENRNLIRTRRIVSVISLLALPWAADLSSPQAGQRETIRSQFMQRSCRRTFLPYRPRRVRGLVEQQRRR